MFAHLYTTAVGSRLSIRHLLPNRFSKNCAKVMAGARDFGKDEITLNDHLHELPIIYIRTAERPLGYSYIIAKNRGSM